MSNVLLCQGALAKNPYYVKEACISLYSIEELCYFIYHYAYILDDTFVNKKLVSWLRDEIDMGDVAAKVETLIERNGSLGNLVRVLNNEVGYYTEDEWVSLLEDIDSNSRLSLSQRRKIRADGLLKSEKYAQALEEYENLLYEGDVDEPSFIAKVYHNLGVCAAKLFMFEKAADYLEKAYDTYPNTESYVEMLSARKLYMSTSEYINYIGDNKRNYEDSLEVERKFEILKLGWGEQPAYKYFREVCKQKDEGNSYYTSVDRLVEEVKENFRGYINGAW